MGRKREFYLIAVLIVTVFIGLNNVIHAIENGSLPVRLAVIGDRTGSHVPGIYGQIIEEVQRLRPDLIMTVGDQIEGYTDDTARLNTEWAEYKKIISSLTMPIHFTPGNHDILSDVQEKIYRAQIGEPYYSYDYCGIHFIILDNGRWEKSDELPAEQIAWLIDDLDKFRETKYTFVFMHKPFWYYTTALGKPDTLHSLFKAYGVDAVFTGHFHQYFSGRYDDITYTSIGSSGGGTEPGPTGLFYHYCWVTVDENDVSVAPIKLGSVLPWEEMTADDYHLASRIERFGFEFAPLVLNDDLRPATNKVTLKINNHCPEKEIIDTLRWNIPDNWSVDPQAMAVSIVPEKSQTVEFQIICNGPLYPVPAARLSVEFAEGKKATIESPVRIAREISSLRAAMPPMVDGNIAEPIWKSPEKQFFDSDGSEAKTDPVAFYFTYDDENLFIAAKCLEKVMDSMKASVVDHDGPVYAEDCIGFFIQPDIDKAVAYQIYINPLGRVFDQKLTMNYDGYMSADRGWDGIYDVKAIHGPDFWTVEAAIPLKQLGISGHPGKKIGLNFRRKQARLAAAADWQIPIDYNPKTFGILKME